MPRVNPSFPGWETWLFTRPANEVGGDLVDFMQVSENRLGLALGRTRYPANTFFVILFPVALLGGIFSVDFEAPQSLRSIGVIPATAGIQKRHDGSCSSALGSGFRRNDG